MNWGKCREIMERSAIKIDDMATDDAYFLATHMPFANLEVYEGGRTSSTPKLMSEDDVFEKLIYNPDNQHRMIIVRGNNGTGKSHLIRYLKARLESSSATVFNPEKEQLVFLRRLNNSVRGAFSQLLEQKVVRDPDVQEKLRKFVDSTESKDEASFKYDILYAYIAAVNSDNSNKTYKSVICRDIASYLSDSRVKEFLLREGGAVSRCYQVITSSSNQVLKDNVIFTEDDFNDRKTIRAVKKQGDPQASDFATTLSEGPEEIEKLVNYLNLFTRDVVQRCAGVSSESTKTVFEELRKELKRQGKNLTLFIEDFTGFTGIDSEMITVLSTEHGGDYDYLCRVTAVIGITDGYYDQFKDNFKDRVTHQISVTERSFGDPEFLVQMAGRYLNAIYTDPEAIRKWYADGASREAIPTSDYFPAYEWDSVDIGESRVTLYPFNQKALVGLYNNLPVKSPRMFLRDVLRAQLKEFFDGKEYGDQWGFPIVDVRIQMTNAVHSSAIDRNEGLSKADRERVKMILALWGNGTATGAKNQNGLFFGGINQHFFQDVNLPFAGIGDIVEDENDTAAGGQSPLPQDQPEQTQVPASPARISARERTYNLRIADINNWFSNNANLQYHPDYRQLIKDFLCGTVNQAGAITWQDLGVPAYIAYERLNDLSAFSIEGQEQSVNSNAIIILDRSVESRDVLTALCREDYTGGWDFESSVYYQQQLIVWLERNKERIIQAVISYQPQENSSPSVITWGLALQFIRMLAQGNPADLDSPIETIKKLCTLEAGEDQSDSRTKEWTDFNSYIRNHKSEFDKALDLLVKSSRTTMGAIAYSKDDSKKAYYRSEELVSSYQFLLNRNWDISADLPGKIEGNFLFTPAKLLKELYPRVNAVVSAELSDYETIVTQIEGYIGEITEETLIEVINAIRKLLSSFSTNGILGYKALRDKYESLSPIEEARNIRSSYQQLSTLSDTPVMKQFSVLSGGAKKTLKQFLKDLQDVEGVAAKEESNAKNEMRKLAIPEGMDEVVEAAKETLALLYAKLDAMEVRNDN